MFLAKSNLALFAPCCEPSVFALVKSSLDCRLWQWHVYLLESVLLLARCCERVFLYHGRILWSSTTVVLHGRPGLFMLLSSPVCSFFSECTKLLIWALLICYLSDGFVLFFKPNNCFTCMESSFDHMMWVQSNSFQMQMAHLESTPELLPA